MNETLCGIDSPVMPVWSKSKISQPNYFSSRRIHKDQDPNLQNCYMVRNMHCEPVPCSYSFHLDSIPFFYFLSSGKVFKGKGRRWLEQSFLQSDLALLPRAILQISASPAMQGKSFTFSASAQYESIPQASALTGVTAESLLQCCCITPEAVLWNAK